MVKLRWTKKHTTAFFFFDKRSTSTVLRSCGVIIVEHKIA